MASKKFINGFRSWMETFYEVVAFIEDRRSHAVNLTKDEESEIAQTQKSQGTCGMYDLAEAWTNEFEKKNKGREWDGEFFDEIEAFCAEKDKVN